MSLRKQIRSLIKNDPGLTNEQLYKQHPGANKTSIRVYAAEFRKLYNKKKAVITSRSPSAMKGDILPSKTGKGAKTPLSLALGPNGKVNEELIEKAILYLYEQGTITPNLVRCMVDYVLKIKGKKDTLEKDLDLEMFKELGIDIENSE